VLELIENGGSTLGKNGTQNRDTDTHGGIFMLTHGLNKVAGYRTFPSPSSPIAQPRMISNAMLPSTVPGS